MMYDNDLNDFRTCHKHNDPTPIRTKHLEIIGVKCKDCESNYKCSDRQKEVCNLYPLRDGETIGSN